jgi:hypothetical protein
MPQLDYEPPPKFDHIEREPPNWRVLPIAIAVVVLVFFVLIPWVMLKVMR